MIIKKAKYVNKMVSQRVLVSDEVYGCDECRKEIRDFPNENPRLDIAVFHHSHESERLHFCSWRCVLKHLPKIKTDYFVSLPFVHYDQPTKDVKEFLKVLSKLK